MLSNCSSSALARLRPGILGSGLARRLQRRSGIGGGSSPAGGASHAPTLLNSPLRGGAHTPKAAASGMAPGALSYRQPLVVPAQGQHTGTVIMLHGLGDTGEGWAPVGAEFAPDLPNVKFVFPNAPMRRITINMGMSMPGWYDISSLEDIDAQEDEQGLRESLRYVESLVAQEEAAGIPSERVIVAGFSQGGAVALMALRSEKKLAAVIGLSTYQPLRNEPPLVSDANKATPLLMCHGDSDMVVNYQFGYGSYLRLKELGLPVEFKSYRGMGHGACPQELDAVRDFIKAKLP